MDNHDKTPKWRWRDSLRQALKTLKESYPDGELDPDRMDEQLRQISRNLAARERDLLEILKLAEADGPIDADKADEIRHLADPDG